MTTFDENLKVVFVKRINDQKLVIYEINLRPEGNISTVEERICIVYEKISNMDKRSKQLERKIQ